jgi:MFS family permease
MTCRVLNAACICPCLGFGSGVVTELFFRHERAQKMGWWTLLVTLGTPCGPFIMGFVVQRVSVHWISWILAIVNFLQFLGYLFFNSETLSHPGSSNTQFIGCETKWGFRRIDKAPFSLQDFLNPFTVCKYPKVLIPVIAYALCFCYANIALIVMMPISFGKKFGLDAQGIGLQFIALIIGSVLGEQVSGPLSDTFLNRYAAKTGRRAPVQRLWLAYPGFLTIFVGILVWGIQLQNAKQGHWNVTPLVGAAIAAFGNQVITTTLITFAVDSYPEKSSHIGGAVNVVRQTWGFVSLHPIFRP